MAFRDVWVGRWNAEGAGIFGMVRVDKSEDLLGCFFFLFFFFFFFCFLLEEGLPGISWVSRVD